MDVMDAGVFVAKYEADIPRDLRPVLWGPLHAKEMGLEGWSVQDGGETGFVMHFNDATAGGGRATATLIVVRRLKRAFLTVYLGGFPADAPESHRRLEGNRIVTAASMYLGRLAGTPIDLALQAEMTLVDNVNDDAVPVGATAAVPPAAPLPSAPEPAPSSPAAAPGAPASTPIWEV